MVFRAID